MLKKINESLKEDVDPNSVPIQLSWIGFLSGVLDATTYSVTNCYASNHTGNAILLAIGAAGTAHVQLLNSGVSIATFLVFGLIAGQLGNKVGQFKRWWLLLTSLFQTILIFIAGALTYTNILTLGTKLGNVIMLFFLASSGGLQVSMARNLSREVPTAMLTSPFIDLLADENLFAFKIRHKKVRSRNLRTIYIILMFGGSFVGAFMHRRYGSPITILFAAGCRAVITFTFLFNKIQPQNQSEEK